MQKQISFGAACGDEKISSDVFETLTTNEKQFTTMLNTVASNRELRIVVVERLWLERRCCLAKRLFVVSARRMN